MSQTLVLLILSLIGASSAAAADRGAAQRESSNARRSNVFKLEELAWPQIDALDRERTIVILPVGMLEEHGPHLPVGADSIGIGHEADEAAARVSRALPDWNIVMMPAINYGQAGANLIGDMPVHPGTYSIRVSTLRSLLADVGGQLAQNRFKWIFVMSGHAAPTHSIAVDEACDFVSETFRVTMLHLTSLLRGDEAIQARGQKIMAKFFSPGDLASVGMDVHAGLSETAQMLAVRPELVRPEYKSLPSRAGRSFDELRAIATAPGWQGYFSSPARASAAYGRAIKEWWIDGFTDLMLRVVRGENMVAHARVPAAVPPPFAAIVGKTRAEEEAFAVKLQNWLAERAKQ